MVLKGGYKPSVTDSNFCVISIQTVQTNETTGSEHGYYDSPDLIKILDCIYHTEKNNDASNFIVEY